MSLFSIFSLQRCWVTANSSTSRNLGYSNSLRHQKLIMLGTADEIRSFILSISLFLGERGLSTRDSVEPLTIYYSQDKIHVRHKNRYQTAEIRAPVSIPAPQSSRSQRLARKAALEVDHLTIRRQFRLSAGHITVPSIARRGIEDHRRLRKRVCWTRTIVIHVDDRDQGPTRVPHSP